MCGYVICRDGEREFTRDPAYSDRTVEAGTTYPEQLDPRRAGLTYNLQNWRQDGGGIWALRRDSGYGFGWQALSPSDDSETL